MPHESDGTIPNIRNIGKISEDAVRSIAEDAARFAIPKLGTVVGPVEVLEAPEDYYTAEERTTALKAARMVVGPDMLAEDLVAVATWILTGEDPWAIRDPEGAPVD